MTDADRRSLLQALDSGGGPGDFLAAAAAAATAAAAASGPGNSTGRGFNGSSRHWLPSGGGGGNFSGGAAGANATGWGNVSGVGEHPTLDKEYHYWMLVMLLVPGLTIFGNVLVVLAVCRERSLQQSVTNYFIVSLAVADILVASIVMPVSVFVEVRNGHWDFSNLLCDLWIMCDALFSTASILNLVAISIDRFIAVTQPIKYAKHKNSKRTHFTIGITWLLSVGIALPIGCGLQNMQGLRHHEKFRHVCTFFNGDFLIYSSLGSFYIPCIVMIVLYYRIFTVIRGRAKKARKVKNIRMLAGKQQQNPQAAGNARNHSATPLKRPQTLMTSSSPAVAAAAASGAAAAAADCLACQTDGIYTGEESVPHTCQQQLQQQQQNQKTVESPQPQTESQTPAGPSNSDNSGVHSDVGDVDGRGKRGGKKQQLFQQLKLRKNKSVKKPTDRSAARREKKATKTLAIVLGVFLFCWVPFFITNLMWAACLKNFDNQESLGAICQYDRRINVFIVWLGYVNSFLNPLIYTIFNTEFRKAFKKLLHIK